MPEYMEHYLVYDLWWTQQHVGFALEYLYFLGLSTIDYESLILGLRFRELFYNI